jgi:hypothetical protein
LTGIPSKPVGQKAGVRSQKMVKTIDKGKILKSDSGSLSLYRLSDF